MTELDAASLIAILAAAFFGGALNAVAGGGSFLTLPALIFAGVPPVAANATGTVALLPGYISGAFGFRQDMRGMAGLGLWGMVAISLAGGIAGALLLLATPDDTFRAIVPWLLLIGTALFAFGDRLSARLQTSTDPGAVPLALGLLAVTTYGGYFNGGLGILLLALFSILGRAGLNAMNGYKNLVSAVLTSISAAAFALAGIVYWPEALIMMAAASTGGYAGARLGRRVPRAHLRAGIVIIGLLMASAFFAT